jgi:uncharacterized membrane protein YjjP (DUF1212 family)
MTLEQRSNLVLALARVLYANGQSTDQTLTQAEQFGRSLGLRAKIIPRWGELQLEAQEGEARIISAVAANPTGVDMDRVASIIRLIEDFGEGRLARSHRPRRRRRGCSPSRLRPVPWHWR